MQRLAMLVAGLFLLLALAGCHAPTAPASTGSVPVALRVSLATFQLQAVQNGYRASDITELRLRVLRGATVVHTLTLPPAELSRSLTLRNLRLATTYRVEAEAYAGATLISDPAGSRTTFTTPAIARVAGIDTVENAMAIAIPLKLADRAVPGKGGFTCTISGNFNGTPRALVTVGVRLMRVSGTTETLAYERTLAIAEINAGQVLPMLNLRPGTTYKLYAAGFNSLGELVTDPARSQSTPFTTPAVVTGATGASVEDTTPTQTLPLVR